MCRLLIFGGTTEGRVLAEHCVRSGIPVCVSVTTPLGAQLLPEGVRICTGALDTDGMCRLMQALSPRLVVDATHPFARAASENIRTAAARCGIRCERLCRESAPIPYGECVPDMDCLLARLREIQGHILCTLGSKALPALTAVPDYAGRFWIRALPPARESCLALGFRESHLLLLQGPFSVAENITHIRRSDAAVLLSKESGSAGGFPEKCEAARQCGIRMLTLLRPPEAGLSYAQILSLPDLEGGIHAR